MKEEKDAREEPVDKSVPVAAVTHALASKLKENGKSGAWWKTEAGIAAKGAEVGLPARNGETYADWKSRIFDALAKRERA